MYSGGVEGHQLLNGSETTEEALSAVVVMASSFSLVGLAFAFITYRLLTFSSIPSLCMECHC